MKFHVQMVHAQVDKSFETVVEEKFSRLEKFFFEEPQVAVVIKKERFAYTIEAKIRTKGAPIFAKETDTDLTTAIDALVNKLKNSLSKMHDRKVDRTHK
jgi:putative sigma-54 modulation protein